MQQITFGATNIDTLIINILILGFFNKESKLAYQVIF